MMANHLTLSLLVVVASFLLLHQSLAQQQTAYEYFTSGGITEGIRADNRQYFTLNGKEIKILAGALHYFRIHPTQWRDRMRKYRAAGLNAIDVYIPWNLHEPERDVFDFGDGGRDFSHFLDLPAFSAWPKKRIFLPGPYICAEWEFGGIPSWLMHDHPIAMRTAQPEYQDRAAIYLREVISRVRDLQFHTVAGTSNGGPIIMTQIENEYGNFGYTDWPRDIAHLRFLKDTMIAAGIETILFTSDSPAKTHDWGNVDDVLMTANFKQQSIENMDRLLQLQPNRPIIVTEYWPGWFDHWFEEIHHTLSVDEFAAILGNIFAYNGSVNFYMFHGGTNFGFMNGGNMLENDNLDVFPYYAPTITSYDYDAPLTESGAYTPKYERAVEMIAAYDPLSSLLIKPERPVLIPAVAYPAVQITEYIDFYGILDNVPPTHREFSPSLLSMEQLSLNNGNGQSYGYIVYRKRVSLRDGSNILIRGHVRDLLQLMVNGKMLNEPILKHLDLNKFGSWGPRDKDFVFDLSQVPIPEGQVSACDPDCTLDLMVENLGRSNYGKLHQFDQRRGLWQGDILIDGEIVQDWEIISMEFKGNWVQGVQGWQPYNRPDHLDFGPRLLRGTLNVPDAAPADSYFDYDCEEGCTDWLHGAVFVNGFNIGRYHTVGPQKTLYVPGPMLHQGDNEIIIFENYRGSDIMQFTSIPYYGPVLPNDNKLKSI